MADAQRRALLGLFLVCLLVVGVEASFGLCTQDDAFISFRYAWNLAEGHGLVYNVGERVEGYTNFLWTVLFAPVIAAGMDPAPVSVSLGMLCTIGLLWATWELGDRHWLPPLLVGVFPGLALEGVQGLETVFYAGLVALALRGGRGWAVFAGLAALTRPEGYALFGVLFLLRRKPRDLLVFGAIAAPHLVFRVLYYGDIVPNTFHAKVASPSTLQGSAVERGVRYLAANGWHAMPLVGGLVVAVGAAFVAARERRIVRPDDGRAGVLWACAAWLLFTVMWVVLVGGDFKGTGRFLIPALPAAAVIAHAALRPKARWVVGLVAVLWAIPGWREMNHFADRFAQELEWRRDVGVFLRRAVPPDRSIAVHAAGIVPYYAQLPTLDMLGLTDAHIARAESQGMGTGQAGHERRDYLYVRSRGPALILPEVDLSTAEPVRLGDPGVFGADFLEDYDPVSMPTGHGYVNAWRRRSNAP